MQSSTGSPLHSLDSFWPVLKQVMKNWSNRTRGIPIFNPKPDALISHNATSHWVTSLDAVYPITSSFFWSHKKLYTALFTYAVELCVKSAALPFKVIAHCVFLIVTNVKRARKMFSSPGNQLGHRRGLAPQPCPRPGGLVTWWGDAPQWLGAPQVVLPFHGQWRLSSRHFPNNHLIYRHSL